MSSSTLVHPKGRADRRPFGLHTLRLMNHCRTSAHTRLQGRRDRSTALTRLTGMAILLMAATIWPMAVFAADPAVETQDNAMVVFTVLVLLFGSVAAGLFFASPLRRRISGDPQERQPQAPPDDPLGLDTDLQRRTQHLFQPLEQSAAAAATPAPPLLREQPLPVMALPVMAPPVVALPNGASRPVASRPVASWPSPTASAQLVIPARSANQAPLYVEVAVTTQAPLSYSSPAVHGSTAPATQAAIQPLIAVRAATPAQAPTVSPHQFVRSPWSTSLPQPDANWNPGRRRAP